MTNIIFDFDNTLIDAGAFRRELKQAVVGAGLAPTAFEGIYYRLGRHPSGFGPDEFFREAESLFSTPVAEAAAREAFFKVVDGVRRYNDRHAEDVLERLSKQGHKLVLLSRGHEGWQRLKLARSGLSPYFSSVIISPGNKIHYLEEAAGPGYSIFINDDYSETLAMSSAAPLHDYLIMAGFRSPPLDCEFPTCFDLDEVANLIDAMLN